jgi:flagellar motor switch protein FliG
MPEKATSKPRIKGPQRAAMVLVMLGEEASANIIKQMPEDDVQLISREIALLKGVDTSQSESVLEEFYQVVMAGQYVMKGGLEFAQNLLVSAFGPEAAKRVLERLMKAMGHDMANFDALQKADPQQLAKFIHSEHPQTIALVLAHLNPAQASALLTSLPPEQRADLALRVANLDQVSPEVINKIAIVIGGKLNALGEFSRESYGGVRTVAEMFNRLDSEVSKEILANLESQDETLTETLRRLMFVFDDLLTLDQNAVKEILARVDRKIPMMALKGTTERMKKHFFQCMSERGAEMMREDMDALGKVKMKDVETAQQEIISIVRKLEAEGVVNLRGAVGGGDEYVD